MLHYTDCDERENKKRTKYDRATQDVLPVHLYNLSHLSHENVSWDMPTDSDS
jgi:hypothetical protein